MAKNKLYSKPFNSDKRLTDWVNDQKFEVSIINITQNGKTRTLFYKKLELL